MRRTCAYVAVTKDEAQRRIWTFYDVVKVSMKKLQTLLRHQNQKTTDIYLKRVDNDLSASMMLLEKKDKQKDTQAEKGLTAVG